MRENSETIKGGCGFSGLLTVVFIVLKLTGVVSWSWWWVLAPAWIPVALFIIALLGIAVAAVVRK